MLVPLCLCSDFPVEAESGDAAVPVADLAAAAAGPVRPGAGAPERAAAGAGGRAPAQGGAAPGEPLLRPAGPGGGAPERVQCLWDTLTLHKLPPPHTTHTHTHIYSILYTCAHTYTLYTHGSHTFIYSYTFRMLIQVGYKQSRAVCSSHSPAVLGYVLSVDRFPYCHQYTRVA